MILVDTSVWVDHLHRGNDLFAQRLNRNEVLMHSFVLGELALGSLAQRTNVLGALSKLPYATPATDAEVIAFISDHVLHGIGIGYVDAHLLAAVHLTPGSLLWTLDKRLDAAAHRLKIRFMPTH